MTQDNWQDCPTMKSVVEAMERGDEFQRWDGCDWVIWGGTYWSIDMKIRCRPAKPKTKTVVMREAFFWYGLYGIYSWDTREQSNRHGFIRYTGNERTEEVPCE